MIKKIWAGIKEILFPLGLGDDVTISNGSGEEIVGLIVDVDYDHDGEQIYFVKMDEEWSDWFWRDQIKRIKQK